MKRPTAKKKILMDLGLIAVLLIVAAVLFLLFSNGEDGAWAEVRVNGEEIARYSLEESGTYPLNGGTNILVIENGEAWLIDANCPDKLCVKQGKIHYTGQCITCLPNKLTVTIYGAETGIELVS